MTSHDTHTQHSSHHQLRIGCVPRAGMGHALAGIPAPPPLWNYVITGVMGSKGWGYLGLFGENRALRVGANCYPTEQLMV